MPVIAFPQAPSRPGRRRINYPPLTVQLAGLQHDLAAAAAQTTDPFAEAEFVSAAKRLAYMVKRLEAGL
jgi:hypothetical protein